MSEKKLINSFGRRIGKRLSQSSQDIIKYVLPQHIVNLQELVNSARNLYLEVGSGNGDFITEFAINNPDTLCIGCEPYLNGVANTLKIMSEHGIDNIKLWKDDVRLLLNQLSDNIFDTVYILFPDPWPKQKQHKRRLINNEFLEFLYNKMKPGAILNVATDHQEYAVWILSHLLNQLHYHWQVTAQNDWLTPFDYAILTRYYKKAAYKASQPYFFRFKVSKN